VIAASLHAHHVAVVSVAVGAHGNFKFVLVVGGIGLRFAEVPFHAAGAQHGPEAPSAMHSSALSTPSSACARSRCCCRSGDPRTPVCGARNPCRSAPHLFQTSRRLRTAARRCGMRAWSGAPRILLEDLQDLFAFAQAVNSGVSANVQRVRAQPNKVLAMRCNSS